MSADHKMADGTERLAKRVAVQQSCSRADAERYIEGGWIAVDGRVVEEPGFRVGASQTVSLLPGARWNAAAGDHPGPQTRGRVCQRRTGLGPRPDRARQPHGGRPLAAALPQAPAAGLRLVTPLERAASGLVVHAGISGGAQAAGRSPPGRTGIHCRGQRQPGRGRTRLAAPGPARRPAGLADAGQLAERNPAAFRAQDARAGLHRVRLRRRRAGTAGLAPHPHRPPAARRAARRPMARAPGLRALWRPTRSAEQPTTQGARPTDVARFHPASAPRFSQTGRHARAGRADPGRLRDPAHRRAALVRRHASGHARAGRAVPPLRPGGRVAIVAPASAAPNAADDAADWLLSRGYQPRIMPAARSRLDTPFDYLAGTDAGARPTCTRPSLPPISMPSGACRAVSAPGACWTCWTTNCCAATPSPSLAIATSRRCIWPSSAMRAS